MRRKGFAAPLVLVGAIFVLIAIVGILFLGKSKLFPLSPSAQIAQPAGYQAEWKTYYADFFSFQYPSSLVVKNGDASGDFVNDWYRVIAPEDFAYKGMSYPKGEIMVIDTRATRGISSYAAAVKGYEKSYQDLYEEKINKGLLIGGKFKDNPSKSNYSAIFPFASGMIMVVPSGSSSGDFSKIKLVRDVLQTFKFLDNPEDSWKVYTNKAGGFSITFPPTMEIRGDNISTDGGMVTISGTNSHLNINISSHMTMLSRMTVDTDCEPLDLKTMVFVGQVVGVCESRSASHVFYTKKPDTDTWVGIDAGYATPEDKNTIFKVIYSFKFL